MSLVDTHWSPLFNIYICIYIYIIYIIHKTFNIQHTTSISLILLICQGFMKRVVGTHIEKHRGRGFLFGWWDNWVATITLHVMNVMNVASQTLEGLSGMFETHRIVTHKGHLRIQKGICNIQIHIYVCRLVYD